MQENSTQTNSQSQTQQSSNDLFDGALLVRLVARNRLLWMSLMGLGLGLGIFFLRITVPQYTSSAKLYVESTSPKLLKESEQAKTAKNYLYTQATVVKSTTVLEKVLERLKEENDSEIARRVLAQTNPASYLDQHLSTSVGKKDDILLITFTCEDPAESAEMVQRIVDAYIAYNASKARNTSGQVLTILKDEKDQTNREQIAKLNRLTEYRKEHKDVIFGSNNEEVMADRLARLSNAMTEAQLSALEAETYHKTIVNMSSDPVQLRQYVRSRHLDEPIMMSGSESTLLHNKINSLQIQLEKLLRILTPEHPSVKAMEDKIATTFQQLETVELEYVQAQKMLAYQQYTAAVEKQQQVQTQYQQQRKIALDVNTKMSEYLLLESDWKQTKKMCDILDERIREVDITVDAGVLNIHVLESPKVAETPSSPDRKRVLAISLILGAALGFVVSLVRDFYDHRFCCDREIQTILNAPVLGVIPQMPNSFNAELISYTHPDSSVAQIYRKLCAFVFFGQNRDENRIFHICSARDNEGKTVTTCNLGIAMAHAGQRTLLIDCNFSHPRLKDVFGLNETAGIAEIAQKECTLPEAIQNTFIHGLDVLHCGRFCGNPITLFNHKKFHSIIRVLRCQYDRVLIDSQSILAFPESLILSHLADVTLLTIQGERSNQQEAVQIQKEHEAIDASLSGVIVNQVLTGSSCYQHRQKWNPGRTISRILDPHDSMEYSTTTNESTNRFQKI